MGIIYKNKLIPIRSAHISRNIIKKKSKPTTESSIVRTDTIPYHFTSTKFLQKEWTSIKTR